jgi:hypothetical protein
VTRFNKCCTSNAVDVIVDYLLQNGSKEDGNVRGECEGDEDNDCEGGNSDSDW